MKREKSGQTETVKIGERTYRVINPFYPKEKRILGVILKERAEREGAVTDKHEGEYLLRHTLPPELDRFNVACVGWTPSGDNEQFYYLAKLSVYSLVKKRDRVLYPLLGTVGCDFRLLQRLS
jgi:hypothetical protein